VRVERPNLRLHPLGADARSGRNDFRVLRVRHPPPAHVQAGVGVEVKLAARAVERQAGMHAELAVRDVAIDAEPPDDAVAVQPGVVEPHLSAVQRLLGLEVVDSEQHAEVEAKPVERVRRHDRPLDTLLRVLASGEIGRVAHWRSPFTGRRGWR
jgi:hypothetical protein